MPPEAPETAAPKAPADPRLKVLKKFHGKFLPKGVLRERYKAIMTRWNSGEDHGGVTALELKTLLDRSEGERPWKIRDELASTMHENFGVFRRENQMKEQERIVGYLRERYERVVVDDKGVGFIVMFGLLGSNRMPGLTAIFLLFTILTSATGFLFPFTQLLPSHMIGILSLVLLLIACIALYAMKLSGVWRPVYVVTALASLYLNVFVLIIQSFLKVPALHALAPGNPPAGPAFAVVQGIVLVFFVIVIIGAWRRYKPMPSFA